MSRLPVSHLMTAVLATGLGVAGFTLSNSSVTAHEVAADTKPVCALSLEDAGRGVRLKAIVEPEEGLSGSYSLLITQASGGNRSSVRQGGNFRAPAGETTLLAMSSFGNASGLSAELSLNVNGKTIDCALPSPQLDT